MSPRLVGIVGQKECRIELGFSSYGRVGFWVKEFMMSVCASGKDVNFACFIKN